ncbi:MAG: methionyl-tRNA formyltransferase [Flavobacteriales bacterium]|jgi:methionyl-tRNA formyltransferase|nr:methionyl-tRNA formyltransferase [Flavobacteriales bacterium]
MSSQLRIVFMGTPDFATESLKRLVENNYNIVGVVTAPDRPAGRGQKIKFSSVKEYAVSQNLQVLQTEKLKNPQFIDELKNLEADLFVVVAFRMLPEIVWRLPAKGTFNLHGSLLPRYRGAAPINWAVINGDKETGVTTFFIEKDIDTGNIIFQEKLSISDKDTAGNIHDKLMHIGSELVCKTIDAIESNKAPNSPQLNETATHAPKIFKADCKVNWEENSVVIHNKIRGLSPYPTAWTSIDKDKTLKLFSSSYENANHNETIGKILISNNKEMKVAAKDGFVHIHELQLSGKKRMKTEDFLRGYNFEDIVLY